MGLYADYNTFSLVTIGGTEIPNVEEAGGDPTTLHWWAREQLDVALTELKKKKEEKAKYFIRGNELCMEEA